MYDINGNQLPNAPYKVNVFGVPVYIPFEEYENCIDEQNISVNTLNKITNSFGNLQYVGGICVNNKIYCTPNTASQVLVYDITNQSTYMINTGMPVVHFKFTGQILYKGKIYMMHRGLNFMLEINPDDDSCRVITLDTKYSTSPVEDYQDSYHYCGAMSDEGFLYQPPAYNNQDVLKIDMRSFEVEKIRINANVFTGAFRVPNENKIVFMGSTKWILWDCDTDTYTNLANMPSGCYDMVYDPRYNIMVGTTTSGVFIALKLDDYTLVTSDAVSGLATGYGISLGLDGKYWHLEGNKAYWAKYSNGTFITGSITSPDTFAGSTPYVAGQAIDTDGSIYGIPASGNMSKLSFNGVVDKLPDYIVSSQYYGKY